MHGNPSLQQLHVVEGPAAVIFHPTFNHIMEEERISVHWHEKHTWRKRRPITPPLHHLTFSPITHLLFLCPPFHLLPIPPSQAPEGSDGSMSGADDVTVDNLRF